MRELRGNTGLYKANLVSRIASVCLDGDWVTSLRISHRRVRGCFHSTLLSLLRFDGLAHVVARWESCLLEHDRSEFSRCRQYLILSWTLVWIVFVVVCLSYSVGAGSVMASSRSSDMDQAGPSSASSGPLPGTFLGLALDMRSDKLCDLVPDIPDVMGLRALRPSAAIVKVMSVPDSRCIQVVTQDDHVNIGFHEVLLHDMEDEDLPFVTLGELDCLCRIWPKILFVFVFMSRYQHDLERMRKETFRVHAVGELSTLWRVYPAEFRQTRCLVSY